MIKRIREFAAFGLYVAQGGEGDAVNMAALDHLTAKALRCAKLARQHNRRELHGAAREMVQELNETRRLYRKGQWKRGRVALWNAALLCGALAAGAAQADGVNIHDRSKLARIISETAPRCVPHGDMMREAEARDGSLVEMSLSQFRRLGWKLAPDARVLDILDHGPRVYTVTASGRSRVFLTNGETACTSRALESRGR